MNEEYAVLQWAQGVHGEDSLLAWAGVPFETFRLYSEAYDECKRINLLRTTNGLPANAFVCKGTINNIGFVPSWE